MNLHIRANRILSAFAFTLTRFLDRYDELASVMQSTEEPTPVVLAVQFIDYATGEVFEIQQDFAELEPEPLRELNDILTEMEVKTSFSDGVLTATVRRTLGKDDYI